MRRPSGIPTLLNGIQYRSRLEAKWAKLFTLLGWDFQYEPFDLQGWIPDFVLLGKYETLVEVKPTLNFPERVADKIDRACRPTPRGSSCLDDQEVLIIGASLLRPTRGQGKYALGWLRECGSWGIAHLGTWGPQFGVGFCHSTGSTHDRMSGEVSRRGPQSHSDSYVLSLWDRAANATQWRGCQADTGEAP